MSNYRQATETIRLAHTARCKLQMAADHPDRNLRFILGHAFTLDKIRLRIAEIEIESSDEEDDFQEPTAGRERRVSFRGNSPRPAATDRKRSPPPDQFAHLEDTDSDSGDEEEEEDVEEEEDNGLSLRRFESASAKPPQMIDDDSSSSDEDEPRSPPPMTEEELKSLTGGDSDTDLAAAYNRVAGCPCHGHHVDAPKVDKVWEVPQKLGEHGGRLAVVQVMA